MSTLIRIAEKNDLDLILNFERSMLQASTLPDEEKIFAEWNSNWRRESLEHHLPLGWSFVALDADGNLIGYFIGQALLFFSNQTQSLWVERLNCKDISVRSELINIAVRLSREKHFQRVYLPEALRQDIQGPHFANYKVESWIDDKFYIKTTRTNT